MTTLFSKSFEKALRKEIREKTECDYGNYGAAGGFVPEVKTIPISALGLILSLGFGWISSNFIYARNWEDAATFFSLVGLASTFYLTHALRAEGNGYRQFFEIQGLPISDSDVFRLNWRRRQGLFPSFSLMVFFSVGFFALRSGWFFTGVFVALVLAAFAHLLRDSLSLGLLVVEDRFSFFQWIVRNSKKLSLFCFLPSFFLIQFFSDRFSGVEEHGTIPLVALFSKIIGEFLIFSPFGMTTRFIQNLISPNLLEALLWGVLPVGLVLSRQFLFQWATGRIRFDGTECGLSPHTSGNHNFVHGTDVVPGARTAQTLGNDSQPVRGDSSSELQIIGGGFLKPPTVWSDGFLDRLVRRQLTSEERVQFDAVAGMDPSGKTRIWIFSSLGFLVPTIFSTFAPRFSQLVVEDKQPNFPEELIFLFLMAGFFLVAVITGLIFITSAIGYRKIPAYDGLKSGHTNPYILFPFDWRTLIRAQRKTEIVTLLAHLPVWLTGFGYAGWQFGSMAKGFEIALFWFFLIFASPPLFSTGLISATRLETPLGNILNLLFPAFLICFYFPLFLVLIGLPVLLSGFDLFLFGTPVAALFFAGNRFVEGWLLKLYDSGRLEMMK